MAASEATYYAIVPMNHNPSDIVKPLEISRHPAYLRQQQERFSEPTRIVPCSTKRFLRGMAKDAIYWRGAELDRIPSV